MRSIVRGDVPWKKDGLASVPIRSSCAPTSRGVGSRGGNGPCLRVSQGRHDDQCSGHKGQNICYAHMTPQITGYGIDSNLPHTHSEGEELRPSHDENHTTSNAESKHGEKE